MRVVVVAGLLVGLLLVLSPPALGLGLGDAFDPTFIDLALSLNLTIFVDALKQNGLEEILNNQYRKFTVFAPTNEAFVREKKYPGVMANRSTVLQMHIVKGKTYAQDIKDEQVARTVAKSRTIRFNIYKNGQLYTVNGRQIASVDHKFANGVLHVINDVISPVYRDEGSIVSQLVDVPNTDTIRMLVDGYDALYIHTVLDNYGPYTFLPPTDGAFAKVSPNYIEYLRVNPYALRQVLLTHVIPHTKYSLGLKNGDIVKTVSGVKLCVAVCEDKVMFGRASVELADVSVSNGVIHTIDEVLSPEHNKRDPDSVRCLPAKCAAAKKTEGKLTTGGRARELPDVFKVLQSMGYNKFAQVLTETHYTIDFLKNLTIFAPSDEAIPDYLNIEGSYHMTKTHVIPESMLETSKLANDQTFDSMDWFSKLRINVYGGRTIFTVNGIQFNSKPNHFDRGVIYKLQKGEFMEPSNQNMVEVMKAIPELATFTGHPEFESFQGMLTQEAYPLTVFAPAVKSLEGKSFSELMMNHMLPKTMFKPGFKDQSWVSTLGGVVLNVTKKEDGTLLLNDLEAVPTASVPTNGALFTVDGLFI